MGSERCRPSWCHQGLRVQPCRSGDGRKTKQSVRTQLWSLPRSWPLAALAGGHGHPLLRCHHPASLGASVRRHFRPSGFPASTHACSVGRGPPRVQRELPLRVLPSASRGRRAVWPLRVCRPVAPGFVPVVLGEDGGGPSSHCPLSSGSLRSGPCGTPLPVPWDSDQLVGPSAGGGRSQGPPRGWLGGPCPHQCPHRAVSWAGGGIGLCCGSRGFVFTETTLTVLGGLGVFTVSPGGPALPSRREGMPVPRLPLSV